MNEFTKDKNFDQILAASDYDEKMKDKLQEKVKMDDNEEVKNDDQSA